MDETIYAVSTLCISKEKAEEMKKELEDKTGYEFKVEKK